MELKNFFAQDDAGNILPSATCYLYERGTETLMQGLRRPNGGLLTNPFEADDTGLIQFAAPNGLYDLRVSKGARDYRLRVQCLDVSETIQDATAAAERAETARDAAELSAGIFPDVAAGLTATAPGGYFSTPSTDSSQFLTLYQNDAGSALLVKTYPSAQALDGLKERFRDGRNTAYVKFGDPYGYNRWLAFLDGSFGTTEASLGPQGMSLSAFDLVHDPANALAVRDQHGYYALRVKAGSGDLPEIPGFQGLRTAAAALEDNPIRQEGKVFAIRDTHGYYAVSLTEDSFAAKGKQPALGNEVSDQALAEQKRRIDDIYGRGELRKMQVAAHRGFSIQAPENTMLAYSMALRRGANVLEIDVQFSADGVPYIFHDTAVDTLTFGTGNFTTLTADQINALTFRQLHGTALESSVRVPLLANYLQFARDECAHTFLELKGTMTAGQIRQVVEMIIAAGLEGLVTVICFTYSYLQQVRALSKSIRLGYLVSATDYAAKVDLAATLAPADISPDATSLIANPGLVEYARTHGVDVTVWTLSDLATTRRLQRIGVNRFTSDATLRA